MHRGQSLGDKTMRKQEIKRLEKEVQKLYFEAKVAPERAALLKAFWEHHIVPVVELSREMAQKYEAQDEVCWMGALFHDFALLTDSEPHDELGAIQVKQFLLERGLAEDLCQQVADVVLTHRCRKFMPETLEQKIVATADAMAHFLPNYYLGIAMVAKEDYADVAKFDVNKLERDYEEKIFFEDEKKLLHERMKDFRKWFYETK